MTDHLQTDMVPEPFVRFDALFPTAYVLDGTPQRARKDAEVTAAVDLALVAQGCQREHERGQHGHWAYSPARHRRMVQDLKRIRALSRVPTSAVDVTPPRWLRKAD